MNLSLTLQYGVLALVLIASVLHVIRKLLPRQSQRLQRQLASRLTRSKAAPLARLGRWLAPKASAGSCGDGCGSCSTGCGPATPKQHQASPQIIKLYTRPKA